jgi:hypothetical protein
MKEAILIIPGVGDLNIGTAIERVAVKLATRQSIAQVLKTSEKDSLHREYDVKYHKTGNSKQIDLIELHWGDIIKENDPQSLTIHKKFFFGIELLTFWWYSPVWKSALKNKLLLTGMVLSSVIILAWFITLFSLFVATMQHEKSMLFDFLSNNMVNDALILVLNKLDITWRFSNVHSINLVYITTLLSVLPTDLVIRTSGFTMNYIKSKIIRDTVKIRIENKMNELLKTNEYNSITLFCHSLGALPTINYLSEVKNDTKTKIKCISIGAPLSFMANNSKELKESIRLCNSNSNIFSWKDYFSKKDWLCSYQEVEAVNDQFYSKQLEMDNSWLVRFSGKVHNQYFDETKIITELIGTEA